VLARSNLRFDIVAESNSFEFLRGMVLRDKAISFQIEIGAVESDELVVRRSTTATCRAPISCSGSCAGAICPCRPRSSPSSLARVLEAMRP
jgi:hypothetical protein